MNFSPYTTQFGIQANSVNQFAAAKLVQNIATANGQVVGLVSGSEGGLHYLRPVDNSGQFQQQTQQNHQQNLAQTQGYITLPITMPGAKPGDAQQTVHIQILNPNPIQHQTAPKFQMGQMQIPIQNFGHQDTTVLTVAYTPQDGEILQNHNLGEGMTIVAALQPQDLPLLSQIQQHQPNGIQSHPATQATQTSDGTDKEDENTCDDNRIISIKQEPVWQNTVTTQTTDYSEYIARMPQALPLNLHQFLKFNTETIKRESQIESSPLNSSVVSDETQSEQSAIMEQMDETELDTSNIKKEKKKRKYKKKPPKPKAPKPGQVHIATALDGTVLYCCPECQMAYPEKENLEQHLSVHKIERRFICDICGAGLKRKEHLERHKSGHNPDRPYICSVCMKGFKRKEHLNLHFVIHSGEKTEICGECGKGFYRKDHLRKHANSHASKRIKEEMASQAAATIASSTSIVPKEEDISSESNQTTNMHEVTIHVPTSNNQTLPVQIQMPQLITTSSPDGTTSTVVLPPQTNNSMMQ